MPIAAVAVVVAVLTATLPASAQSPDPQRGPSASAADQAAAQDPVQVEELRRRLDLLAAEVERLRSGEPEQLELSEARRRALGLAPSAAATYRRATEGVSFA